MLKFICSAHQRDARKQQRKLAKKSKNKDADHVIIDDSGDSLQYPPAVSIAPQSPSQSECSTQVPAGLELNNEDTGDDFHEHEEIAAYDQLNERYLAFERRKRRRLPFHQDTQDFSDEEENPRNKKQLCSTEYLLLLEKDNKLIELEIERARAETRGLELKIELAKLEQLREHNKTNH